MNTNQPDHFVKTARKHRALAVLRALNQAPQYRSNELVIMEWLDNIGLGCTNAEFQQVTETLQRDEYIKINSVGDISVLNLTEIGAEIAEGLRMSESVARPWPNRNY